MTDYYTQEALDKMPPGSVIRVTKLDEEDAYPLPAKSALALLTDQGEWHLINQSVIPEAILEWTPEYPADHPAPSLGELVALRDSLLRELGITPSGPAIDMCHAKLYDVDQHIAKRFGWDS